MTRGHARELGVMSRTWKDLCTHGWLPVAVPLRVSSVAPFSLLRYVGWGGSPEDGLGGSVDGAVWAGGLGVGIQGLAEQWGKSSLVTSS